MDHPICRKDTILANHAHDSKQGKKYISNVDKNPSNALAVIVINRIVLVASLWEKICSLSSVPLSAPRGTINRGN
jgi:hypothetical protein